MDNQKVYGKLNNAFFLIISHDWKNWIVNKVVSLETKRPDCQFPITHVTVSEAACISNPWYITQHSTFHPVAKKNSVCSTITYSSIFLVIESSATQENSEA